jgi:hypothetical protein
VIRRLPNKPKKGASSCDAVLPRARVCPCDHADARTYYTRNSKTMQQLFKPDLG